MREILDEHGATEKAVGQEIVNNVIRAMEGMRLVPGELVLPVWLGSASAGKSKNLLSMSNGLLDLDAAVEGKIECLQAPTPEWFSLTRWGYSFDPAATCPKFEKFLSEVLPGQDERNLLQEFLGYCLTFDTSMQKFLILVGEGANGKSVVTEVATHLIGFDNVTHVGLERFGERFALAPTIGKLVNIVSEVGKVGSIAEEVLKAIATGDRISVEFKFRTHTQARPTVRLIFATNELPTFNDRTDGLWRRALILQFPITIPEDRQDRKLAKKIIDTELSGVFNWAITGLRRLRQRGGFKIPASSRHAGDEHRRASNPARQFLEEVYCPLAEAKVPCSTVRNEYREWCGEHGVQPLTDQQFGQEVRRVYPGVQRCQLRHGKSREYFYLGLQSCAAREAFMAIRASNDSDDSKGIGPYSRPSPTPKVRPVSGHRSEGPSESSKSSNSTQSREVKQPSRRPLIRKIRK